MHPVRCLECNFDPGGKDHGGNATEADDKKRRSVCWIGKGIIKVADFAFRFQAQKSTEDAAQAASRAASAKPGFKRWQRRPLFIVPMRPLFLVIVSLVQIRMCHVRLSAFIGTMNDMYPYKVFIIAIQCFEKYLSRLLGHLCAIDAKPVFFPKYPIPE